MSLHRVYAYRDMVLIPTVAQTEAGFYLDLDPVTICDTADKEKLTAALVSALSGNNQIVPTPPRSDEPGSVILEKLKLRKWLSFEAEAMMYTIQVGSDSIECYSTGRAVDGTWRRQQSKHMNFEASGGLGPLVSCIISDIEHEKAAASSPKSGGLMLLGPVAEDSREDK